MKRKNRLIALIAIVCVLGTVNALSIESDKEAYPKGSIILINGECEEELQLAITSIGKEIGEESIECVDGNYGVGYKIEFSDPSGVWELRVGEESVTVTVNQVRESQFYLITFLSPSAREQERGTEISISVRVTDAGEIVETDKVFTWLPNGRRQRLSSTGNGVYSLGYKIPFDEELGQWKIRITAEKETGEGVFGGENSAIFEIVTTPIGIDIIEPKARQFGAGSIVPTQIRAGYKSGVAPPNASASITYGTETFEMENQGNGIFTHELQTTMGEIGVNKAKFTVTDQFGNQGIAELELTIVNDFLPLLLLYAPYAALALIVGLVLFYGVLPQLKAKKGTKNLKNKRKELKKEMQALQKEYFNKGSVGKEKYNKRISEMNAELSDAEETLKKDKP